MKKQKKQAQGVQAFLDGIVMDSLESTRPTKTAKSAPAKKVKLTATINAHNLLRAKNLGHRAHGEVKMWHSAGSDFEAYNKAEKYVKSKGLQIGSMCSDAPIALAPARQYAYIAKWFNIPQDERQYITGVLLSDDFRGGDVYYVELIDAVEKPAKAEPKFVPAKVEQFCGVKDQIVVTSEDGTRTLYSHESVIAIAFPNGRVVLGPNWNYSSTMARYRTLFLGESTKETEAQIKHGYYTIDENL